MCVVCTALSPKLYIASGTLHGPEEKEAPRIVPDAVEPAVVPVSQNASHQEQPQPARPRAHQTGLDHLAREEPPRLQQ